MDVSRTNLPDAAVLTKLRTARPSERFSALFYAAEIYTSDRSVFGDWQFAPLERRLEAVLEGQRQSTADWDTELAFSCQVDLLRWSVLYRMARCRSPRRTFFNHIGKLFLLQDHDPWCNLMRAFGKGCESCPLITCSAAPFLEAPSIPALDCFMRCKLQNKLFGELAGIVARNEFSDFKKFVYRNAFNNPAVKVWHAHKGLKAEQPQDVLTIPGLD